MPGRILTASPGAAACETGCRPWRALLLAVALVLGALTLAGCGRDPVYRQESFVFGTLVEVTVWGEDETRAKAAVGRLLRAFDALHAQLHAWKPSEVTRMNDAFARGPAPVEIRPELAALLQQAQRLAAQSDGLFDPAIGGLVELWGFHADEFRPRLPDPAVLAQWKAARPTMRDVTLTATTAASSNPRVRIDPGGFAKGYALDLAVRMLKQDGIANALVNIGGNIMALGERGNRPWRVGLQHPRRPGPLASLDLYDGEAVGTSGDYQRYFELDGKRYCHILDPRTGEPVQGVQAVTILVKPAADAGLRSDADSKPLFVAGPQGWRAAAQRMGLDYALLIDGKGEVYATTLMAKRLTPTDNGTVIRTVP